jgi:hypothetical protein
LPGFERCFQDTRSGTGVLVAFARLLARSAFVRQRKIRPGQCDAVAESVISTLR